MKTQPARSERGMREPGRPPADRGTRLTDRRFFAVPVAPPEGRVKSRPKETGFDSLKRDLDIAWKNAADAVDLPGSNMYATSDPFRKTYAEPLIAAYSRKVRRHLSAWEKKWIKEANEVLGFPSRTDLSKGLKEREKQYGTITGPLSETLKTKRTFLSSFPWEEMERAIERLAYLENQKAPDSVRLFPRQAIDMVRRMERDCTGMTKSISEIVSWTEGPEGGLQHSVELGKIAGTLGERMRGFDELVARFREAYRDLPVEGRNRILTRLTTSRIGQLAYRFLSKQKGDAALSVIHCLQPAMTYLAALDIGRTSNEMEKLLRKVVEFDRSASKAKAIRAEREKIASRIREAKKDSKEAVASVNALLNTLDTAHRNGKGLTNRPIDEAMRTVAVAALLKNGQPILSERVEHRLRTGIEKGLAASKEIQRTYQQNLFVMDTHRALIRVLSTLKTQREAFWNAILKLEKRGWLSENDFAFAGGISAAIPQQLTFGWAPARKRKN